MKGVFLVLSGVADESCAALGQATPLQAARTPNLDALARMSKIDYCHPVKEGVAPESSSALISLFGYDANGIERGGLEALGAGIKLARGDLAMRVNFSTIDGLKEGNILDRRAGGTLNSREAKILAKEINSKVKLPFKFEFVPTLHHRGVIIFRGGFSDNISSADPFYRNGTAHAGVMPEIVFSKSLDEEEDSKLTANLINSFVRKSHQVLDEHVLNGVRAKKGLFSANYLLCRGASSDIIRFKKLKGNWMALGYTPLEKGVAKAMKMDIYDVAYPKMKGMDVYDNLNAGLNKAMKRCVKMLKKYRKSHDYFFISFKELDVAGHDNKPHEKVKMLEMMDKKFFSFLKKYVEKNNGKLVITSDHVTSCRLKTHSSGAVPVLYFDSSRKLDVEQRFTEEQGLVGKKIVGKKLLEKTLFVK
jgi:2,3-bisphosphoglycerate-independent phosphoglycerate mutase